MSQFISLQAAAAMTALYRNHREDILQPSYRGANILPICESSDRSAFDTILSQTGCTGLRIYYGMKEDFTIHVIIVGVNTAGEDMLPPGSLSATETGDEIIENGNRCPDLCPPASPLNA
jgi:hypothetical protein